MYSPDNVIIRNASAEDVSAIACLHNSVIEEGLLTCSIPETEEAFPNWLADLERLRYPRLVALSENALIGFAALEPVWISREDNGCKYSATLNVLVQADYRKDGLGTRLFEQLCLHPKTLHRKIYRVACDILSINEAAVSWLHSAGFYFCGSFKGVAQRAETVCDLAYFSKFISPKPQVVGLGYPSSSEPSPCLSRSFALPIKPESVHIRDATMADLPDIVGIVNSAILYSDALALTVPLQVSERTEWLPGLLGAGLPCLVAIIDNGIVGYASLNAFSSDPCFSRTLELSVYVRRDLIRQRIGQQLGEAVLKHRAVEARGTRVIVAQIHHNNGPGSGSILKANFDHCVSIAHDFFKDGELQSYSWYSLTLGSQSGRVS